MTIKAKPLNGRLKLPTINGMVIDIAAEDIIGFKTENDRKNILTVRTRKGFDIDMDISDAIRVLDKAIWYG